MNIFYSVILGIIQGLTEFLPVSSSGHLVIFQRLFGAGEESLAFNIMLHIATLIPVIIIFRKELFFIIRRPFDKIAVFIILATIPTAIAGFLFKDFFTYIFYSASYLGLFFIITGFILFCADYLPRYIKKYDKKPQEMSYRRVLIIGLAQSAAIFPGLSRSGATIAAGVLCGLSKKSAIKFSFLISIPAIIGPVIFDIRDLTIIAFQEIGLFPLASGMIAAGIAGYLSIRFMLNIFSRTPFKIFSYYVFIIGALIILDNLFFKIIF